MFLLCNIIMNVAMTTDNMIIIIILIGRDREIPVLKAGSRNWEFAQIFFCIW